MESELGTAQVQIRQEELGDRPQVSDPPNSKADELGKPEVPRRLPPIGEPEEESRPPSQLRRRGAARQAEAANEVAIEPEYTPRHKLAIDSRTLRVSLIALRIAVFADAINSQILSPNFPIMCVEHGTVGAHEDSWDSTGGFGFNAAVYFVMMSGQLGTAIASTGMGALSDRIGRRPLILVCLYAGTGGSILKFLLRGTFWGFCGANFLNGCFAATMPVAMAYVSDVSTTKAEAEGELGYVMMLYMLGASGGGICAILMEEQGLFEPLFLGAAMSFAAALFAQFSLIEPRRPSSPATVHAVGVETDDAEETKHEGDEAALAAPEEIKKMPLINIAVGSLADNIGSAGLMPLCMTPLMFNTFYLDMVAAGKEPIMNVNAYKWIFVMAALLVIPGVAISLPFFKKFGVAASCILGNLITAAVTVTVLYIGLAEPSELSFGFFIAAVYMGFPFTVLSQLTTAPMLDAVTPAKHRGFVQGLNITVMAFGSAVSPFMLGAFADSQGTKTCILLCVGISLFAAAINLPLLWVPALKKEIPETVHSTFEGEDAEIVKRAEEGKYVPFADLDQINDARMRKGLPLLKLDIGTYADDEHQLEELRSRALQDFKGVSVAIAKTLKEICDSYEARIELCEMFNKSRPQLEKTEEQNQKIGKWFTDYLNANGYWMGDHPTVLKQMIMSAFPPLLKSNIPEPDTIEGALVKSAHVMSNHIGNTENENSIFKQLGSSTPRDLSHLSEH